MLAKYDHASQYETNSGANDAGTLYGGRDKSYADAVGMVIGNDPPSGSSEAGSIGGFKVCQSEVHQVVYGSDSDGLCLAVITGLKYPSRVAIQMLIELYGEYSSEFALQAKSATTNSLTKKSKSTLQAKCKKFDDLSKVDKTSAIIGKVDEVKVQMQDNISAMLKNTEQAESLAERSDQLNEQASVFKKKSTDLRKQMRCKNLKMTVILVGLVAGVLAIILVPLIMKAKRAATGN
jgi:vesicle-associated membrane protein 7